MKWEEAERDDRYRLIRLRRLYRRPCAFCLQNETGAVVTTAKDGVIRIVFGLCPACGAEYGIKIKQ